MACRYAQIWLNRGKGKESQRHIWFRGRRPSERRGDGEGGAGRYLRDLIPPISSLARGHPELRAHFLTTTYSYIARSIVRATYSMCTVLSGRRHSFNHNGEHAGRSAELARRQSRDIWRALMFDLHQSIQALIQGRGETIINRATSSHRDDLPFTPHLASQPPKS